jgi:hypothetical protein
MPPLSNVFKIHIYRARYEAYLEYHIHSAAVSLVSEVKRKRKKKKKEGKIWGGEKGEQLGSTKLVRSRLR